MLTNYFDIKDRVFALASETKTDGLKIWNRIRYADDFQDKAIRKLYFDDNDALNVWFIFLSLRSPVYLKDSDILFSVDYTFTFMGIRSVVDQPNDNDSTRAVEQQIMTFAETYEQNVTLGLDAGVSHTGFRASIIGGVQLAYQAHIINGSLTVRTEDC